jgi:UDP:flavonoid glycosyltransferase YjiC (YdhE family)
VRAEVPVVHVTQGTANVDPRDLILPALEALAGEPGLVVVGTGHRTAALPGPLPANARAAQMLPYPELLPRTAVMVTNGGYGGVLQALRHDVPLVVAGGDLDKPEIAARVGWHGAGIDLRTGTPEPAAILAACRRAVTVPSYRAAAARLGADLRARGGPAGATPAVSIRIVCRAASTRGPAPGERARAPGASRRSPRGPREPSRP